MKRSGLYALLGAAFLTAQVCSPVYAEELVIIQAEDISEDEVALPAADSELIQDEIAVIDDMTAADDMPADEIIGSDVIEEGENSADPSDDSEDIILVESVEMLVESEAATSDEESESQDEILSGTDAGSTDESVSGEDAVSTDENTSDADETFTDENASDVDEALTDENVSDADEVLTDESASDVDEALTDENASDADEALTDERASDADETLTEEIASDAEAIFADENISVEQSEEVTGDILAEEEWAEIDGEELVESAEYAAGTGVNVATASDFKTAWDAGDADTNPNVVINVKKDLVFDEELEAKSGVTYVVNAVKDDGSKYVLKNTKIVCGRTVTEAANITLNADLGYSSDETALDTSTVSSDSEACYLQGLLVVTINGNITSETGGICVSKADVTVQGDITSKKWGCEARAKAVLVVTGDVIVTDSVAVTAWNQGDITVKGDVLSEKGTGVLAETNSSIVVEGNVTSKEGKGVYVEESSSATIKGNVSGGTNGIYAVTKLNSWNYTASYSTVTVEGNVTSKDDVALCAGRTNVTIGGSVSSEKNGGIYVYSGEIVIGGNIISNSATQPGITAGEGAWVTVKGSVTAASDAYAVYVKKVPMWSGGKIVVEGDVNCVNGICIEDGTVEIGGDITASDTAVILSARAKSEINQDYTLVDESNLGTAKPALTVAGNVTGDNIGIADCGSYEDTVNTQAEIHIKGYLYGKNNAFYSTESRQPSEDHTLSVTIDKCVRTDGKFYECETQRASCTFEQYAEFLSWNAHTYDTVVEADDDAHIYECSVCRNISESEDHYGGSATCTKSPVCEACGTSYGEPDGHVLEQIDEVDETCTEEGNIAYWICNVCELCFEDEDGELEISKEDTVISAAGHELEETDEEEAACTEDGNIRYWTCENCGLYFADADGAVEISKKDTVTSAIGHKMKKTDEKKAACTEDGNMTYWTCENCGLHFADENGAVKISVADTVVKATGHTLKQTDAKKATCTKAGNTAYWTCSTCKLIFSNKAGTKKISKADTVKKATGHLHTVLKNKKKATYQTAGYTGDTYCKDCGKKLSSGKKIAKKKETITSQEIKANNTSLNKKLTAVWKGSGLKITWGKVKKAQGYDIYVVECGKQKLADHLVKTVKNTLSTQITKVNGKKLNSSDEYKIMVRAYRTMNGKKTYIGKSLSIHVAGKTNKKYTNVKKLVVKKTAYVLKKGKSVSLQPTILTQKAGLKLLSKKHCLTVRYCSTDRKVAQVDINGKIKAVGKGTCYVYLFAQNGTKIRVQVKVK